MVEDYIERLVSAISSLGTYDEVRSATTSALEAGIPAVTLAGMLASLDKLVEWMHFQPDVAHTLLKKCTETVVA